MAHMAVVFAELERHFIWMRTRQALQVKKENGVKLGRPWLGHPCDACRNLSWMEEISARSLSDR